MKRLLSTFSCWSYSVGYCGYNFLHTMQNTIQFYLIRYNFLYTIQNTIQFYLIRYNLLYKIQNTIQFCLYDTKYDTILLDTIQKLCDWEQSRSAIKRHGEGQGVGHGHSEGVRPSITIMRGRATHTHTHTWHRNTHLLHRTTKIWWQDPHTLFPNKSNNNLFGWSTNLFLFGFSKCNWTIV